VAGAEHDVVADRVGASVHVTGGLRGWGPDVDPDPGEVMTEVTFEGQAHLGAELASVSADGVRDRGRSRLSAGVIPVSHPLDLGPEALFRGPPGGLVEGGRSIVCV
jgi:hypothetical protein